MAQNTEQKKDDKGIFDLNHEADGTFKCEVSSFRSWISNEPGAKFPAERGRYVSPRETSY